MTTRAATKSRPDAVWVSPGTAREIEQIAEGAGRSVAFVVERALAAAKLERMIGGAPGVAPLVLALDQDDPADLRARISKRGKAVGSLDLAVEAAWAKTRERFVAWVAREQEAQKAEVADDLDRELEAARAPKTSCEQLAVLGASVYPRVRALVAAHAATDTATLTRLARDREPYVRDAVANRRVGSREQNG